MKKDSDFKKLKGLFSYYLKLKKQIIILGVLFLIITLISLPIPYLNMVLLDSVIGDGRLDLYKIVIIIWFLLLLISPVLQSVKNYHLFQFDIKLDLLIRKDLVNHVLHLPVTYFNRQPTGYIQSRIENDIKSLNSISIGKLMEIFFKIIMILFSTIMMLRLSVRLTIMVFCVMPLVAVNNAVFAKRINLAGKNASEQWANQSGVLFQILSGIENVKLFCFEKRSLSDFIETNHKTNQAYRHKVKTEQFAGFTGTFLSGLGNFMIWAAGALYIIKGQLTIGEITAFLGYSSYVYAPTLQLLGMKLNMQTVVAAWERIAEIFQMEREDSTLKPDIRINQGKIEICDLSFQYEASHGCNLNHINMSIKAGERILLQGENGSGKTTLIKLLAGIYDYRDGSIRIDGQEVRDYNKASLRESIAVVSQNVYIFSGTIRDNITMYDEEVTKKELDYVTELIGLNRFIASLERGLDTYVNENGSNLSGGQKQLISIARALVKKNRRIIIMDEAASALDVTIQQQLLENMEQLFEGRTVLNISHQSSFSGFEDRVIRLKGGCCAEYDNT